VASTVRLAFVVVLLAIGVRAMFIGMRDGMARRRIRSRWPRERRELTGGAAIWYGAMTSIMGAVLAAAALWLLLAQP
jgi:hypothetical protein